MEVVFFNTEFLLLTVAVFIAAFAGTRITRSLARKNRWVVHPREDRWHTAPTALHGGVGFYPAFFLGSAWILFFKTIPIGDGLQSFNAISSQMALALALVTGSLVMFLIGWWDDVRPFRPATKLLFQMASASLFISAGGIFHFTGSQVLDVLLTYFWFVGIINAVNMLDNMDGLSSGVVILSCVTLVILAVPLGAAQPGYVLAVPFGLILIAALLGFWFHNRPPATIFMGDSGSLAIGYVLAALAVPSSLNGFMGIHPETSVLGPVMVLLIPVTVLSIPIFDTTLVTITRKWRAQKASQGGKDHSSHRLIGLGLSEKKALLVFYALAAFGGAVAVLMQHFPDQALPLFGVYGLTLAIAGVYLGHVKIKRIEPDEAPPSWTPVVATLLYKRRAGEVLLDMILIVSCFYGAYLLRFEGNLPEASLRAVLNSLPIVVSSCLLANFMGGVYRGQWRLITVSDLPYYAGSVLGGVAASMAIVTLISRFEPGHSRSAYIIFGLLFFLALAGSRISFRFFDALASRFGAGVHAGIRKPILIYGAGKAGKLLHEEATFNTEMNAFRVIGFVDDDPNKIGRRLCGLPVRSGAQWAGQASNAIGELWISSRLIPDEKAKRLASQFDPTPVVCRLRLQIQDLSEIEDRRTLKEAIADREAVGLPEEEVDVQT